MSFVTSALIWFFESAVGKLILKTVWDDLSGLITSHIEKKKAAAAALASVKPLEDAKDGKAIDAATDSALDNT